MDKNKTQPIKEMPHNLEAEQALLGCILLDVKIQTEVVLSLKEDDFYSEQHKSIFKAILEIVKQNRPADFITVSELMEKNGTLELAGGIAYLAKLTDYMPSSAKYKSYLDIVTTNSLLRNLIHGAADIIEESRKSTDKKDALTFAERKIFEISEITDTNEMVNASQVVPDVISQLDEICKDKTAIRGVNTGYRDIDNMLNGLHKSDLVILAARPSVGKTSLAMNIVENIALAGKSCIVFSLEMSKEQLVQRMICSIANVSMSKAMRGQLDRKDWLKIAKARELINNTKIYIVESAIITPQEMISKCRRLKAQSGLDFIMVDYIQLMSSKNSKNAENRQQEITEISRNLKIMAKEINVPVLALSQLSRATEKEKRRPQLADLRESGSIEQDADIVMFIHNPEKGATEKDYESKKVVKNVRELIVEKNRNGQTGLVYLYFNGETTKFLTLEKGQVPEEITSEESFDGDNLREIPVQEVINQDNGDDDIF